MKQYKKYTIIIIIMVLILLLLGVTYTFFNYTRTGGVNTISVGRISFSSTQNGSIELINAFPITSTEALTDTTNAKSMSITITGDTDYANGVEYLVTVSDNNLAIGEETHLKTLPVSLIVDVDANGTGTLGTLETGNYYTNRNSYSVSKYKIEYDGDLAEGSRILVGYIAPNTTSGIAEGINGIINITAFIDKDKIVIADTYDGTESNNMGTANDFVGEKEVFTTAEWNEIQQSPLSFKIKVEANEGIWVEEKPSLYSVIASNSLANYISIYSGNTNDTVRENLNKETVYYYTGDNSIKNNNVVFAGHCWQIVRTTDDGGVKLIYNGLAGLDITESVVQTNNDITYTNDSTYPYTYDSETKKWTSSNFGVANSNDTFIFNVNATGDYVINYNITSNRSYDRVLFYVNNVTMTRINESDEGMVGLGHLTTSDTVKVVYQKGYYTNNNGTDMLQFDIVKITSYGTDDACFIDRGRTPTGVKNVLNYMQIYDLSGTTLYGRNYDYSIETQSFSIKDSEGLPTRWSENDSNNNNIVDYEELIGTYTCLNNSISCQELYYVGGYFSSTSAYAVSYVISNADHYSLAGSSVFNRDTKSIAYVGYMYNKAYNVVNGLKTGEYHTNATWNGTTYVLSSADTPPSNPDSTHRYICDTDCSKVRFYFYSSSGYGFYVVLNNGQTVESALKDMINYKVDSSEPDAVINVKDSTIKQYLENWYEKNIAQFKNYLDNEVVYCNDRKVSNLGGWDPNGTINNDLKFNGNSLSYTTLECENLTDSFSKSNSSAKLKYSIGLLSYPERLLNAKLGNESFYWLLSASSYSYSGGAVTINSSSNPGGAPYYTSQGVRPVITLKPGTKIEKGTGTYDNPYIVGLN